MATDASRGRHAGILARPDRAVPQRAGTAGCGHHLRSPAYGPADPARDLVAVRHLLGEGARHRVRTALGCHDVQWRRGMAWAFEQSVGLVWYYADSNPVMSRWGRRTLDRIVRARPLG